MKEKIALGVFIFSVLVLALLISTAILQTPREITGRAVEKTEEKTSVEISEKSCADSDAGRNYGVKGEVSYCDSEGKCLSEEDFCSGKKLTERYCENNENKYEEKECDVECDSGACLSIVTKYTQVVSSRGGGGRGSSGGGTSGGVAAVETGETHDIGQLSLEHTLEIAKNDEIKLNFGGQDYALTLKELTGAQATININTGATLILAVGKEEKMDLNNDGITDGYIRVRNINTITGKVKITLNLA